jgi:hypothetical protein
MSEEEIVNPQIELEEACKPQCIKALLAYQACSFLLNLDFTFVFKALHFVLLNQYY